MNKYVSVFLVILFVCIGTPAFAKKKKHNTAPNPYKYTIVVAGPLSITVTVGSTGVQNENFKIDDNTKVTIDGVASPARNLMAGMVANITSGADKALATSIDASDPKPHYKK